MKEGQAVQLTDGSGGLYEGTLTKVTKKAVEVAINDVQQFMQREHAVHIAIGPTKNSERIEFFVEKAVEIGVEKISFIQSQYSERKSLRLDRVERVAVSAMKQSKNLYLPQLCELQPLTQWLPQLKTSNRLLAWEGEPVEHLLRQKQLSNSTTSNEWCILVGPEGGFSDDELDLLQEQQFERVSLGPTRLRTETAGIVACTLMNHYLI